MKVAENTICVLRHLAGARRAVLKKVEKYSGKRLHGILAPLEGQIETSGTLGMKLYGLSQKVGQEGMLMQWAEELGELQHEVLKLARILHGKSPTPENRAMVEQKIREELIDAMICQRGCGFASPSLIDARQKIERWAERMEEHG